MSFVSFQGSNYGWWFQSMFTTALYKIWVFPKIMGKPPNHPFVHRVFHEIYNPFWWFSPYFWKHPYRNNDEQWIVHHFGCLAEYLGKVCWKMAMIHSTWTGNTKLEMGEVFHRKGSSKSPQKGIPCTFPKTHKLPPKNSEFPWAFSSSLRPVAMKLWWSSLVNLLLQRKYQTLPNSAKVVQKLNFCFVLLVFRNFFTFLFEEFRGGVIRISPYSMYLYFVYIIYRVYFVPLFADVVFQQTCLKHLTCLFRCAVAVMYSSCHSR